MSCKHGILVTREGVGKRNHTYSNEAHRDYATSLGIPPNYPKVRVCQPGGAVLYVAEDSMGRMQSRYSQEHVNQREEQDKPRHIAKLKPEVWRELKVSIDKAISSQKWTVDKLAATAVLLIQSCFFRPGTRAATGPDAHFGVLTLKVQHVSQIANGNCKFEFTGKSGKINRCEVEGEGVLCTLLKQLKRDKGVDEHLFRFGTHSLKAGELRSFLKRSTSLKEGLRPKDIRTYNANLVFLQAMRDIPVRTGKKASSRIAQAIDRTASRLSNTRAIAKKSYILAPVLAAAKKGLLDRLAPGPLDQTLLDIVADRMF